MKDVIKYLKDWRIWFLACALFIYCELFIGCTHIQMTERGIQYHKELNEDWSFYGRAITNFKNDHKVYGLFYTTFNLEELF